MIVYKNSAKGFLEDTGSNVIARKIKASVLKSMGWEKISINQENSWINSMQFMGNVVRNAEIAEDCGVLIEYNIPSTSLRADFIISGHDEAGQGSFIIIELKQWQEASSTNKDGIVHTHYHGYETHPSYQAYSYKLFLKDFNANIYNSTLQAYSCAYLHNYIEKNPEPLKDELYKSIVKDTPLYFADDQRQLEEFIKIYVGKGKGEDILYKIEKGNIRPSKKLIDHVSGLFAGNAEFVLLDEQKVAFEIAKDIAINAKEKTVIIINGGPGTGKSVVSMNLLGELLKADKNVIFIAPNSSFRDVMVDRLTKNFDKNRVKHLLRGSSSFYGARKNTFDVMIIDEAHRLKNGNAFMYKGNNQIEDIINAGKVCIFFVDEKQVIRPEDIGSEAEIIRVSEFHKAKIQKLTLSAQFRCSGAQGYVNWIDDVLHIQRTGNFNGWDKQDFEFKIFTDPNTLRDAIKEKAISGNSARILAGYAWKWTAALEGNSNGQVNDILIPEFGFGMPWNSRNVGTTWAIDDIGADQVGCVHTSQGLEFDYVGVIIGKDLQYNLKTRDYFTDWDEYKDNKGKQGLKGSLKELNALVRNIYRILLTRGMKGCYVYCVDEGLREHLKEQM